MYWTDKGGGKINVFSCSRIKSYLYKTNAWAKKKTTWNLTDLFSSFQYFSKSEFPHLKCHFLSWPFVLCAFLLVGRYYRDPSRLSSWKDLICDRIVQNQQQEKHFFFFFCFSHCRQLMPFTSPSFRASLPTVSIVYCCKRIRRASNSSGTLRPAVASWHTHPALLLGGLKTQHEKYTGVGWT